VVKRSDTDKVTVIAAGVTLYEALKAYEELMKENIALRVIDLYSIKPIDGVALKDAARTTKAIITVEDHAAEGGIGRQCEAHFPVSSFILLLFGTSEERQARRAFFYEEISKEAIIRKVKEFIYETSGA